MKHWLSRGLVGMLGFWALACQSASGGGGFEDGNLGGPGCDVESGCASCDSCFSRCVCDTGDTDACVAACGEGGSGQGGSDAQGGAAQGGSDAQGGAAQGGAAQGGSDAQGGAAQGGAAQGGQAGTDAGGTSGSSGSSGSGGSAAGSGGSGGTSGSGGSAGSGGSSGSSGSGGSGGGTTSGAAATGISISQVSVWQSVKVTLMNNGAGQSPNAPVVAGRDALVRVYVSPGSGWQSRSIVGRLTVGGQSLDVTATPSGTSSDASLGSSLNFNVPGSWITGSSSFSVELLEASSGTFGGSSSGSRYPASGTASLAAESPNGAFKLKLVPIRMNGYEPDLSSSRVETYRQHLLAMYPIASIDLTVRATWSYSGSVSASGSGWSSLLSSLQSLRQSDNPSAETYYYGVMAPASRFSSFCGGGCTAGLGSVPSANSDYYRAAIGLGFFPDGSNSGSSDTLAHEVGHTLGREHAPCGGVSSYDGNFPYSGGGIGSWGYDVRSQKVLSPSGRYDVMGYCDPTWLSDYTYGAMFDRIAYVNANPDVHLPVGSLRAAGAFEAFTLRPDGTLESLGRVQLRAPAMGDAALIHPVDEQGRALAAVSGYFTPYGDDELGGTLLVPVRALPSATQGLISKGLLLQLGAPETLEPEWVTPVAR
ncbi:MAG: M66 family metalloprotease [Polyangiaceae bacterium]